MNNKVPSYRFIRDLKHKIERELLEYFLNFMSSDDDSIYVRVKLNHYDCIGSNYCHNGKYEYKFRCILDEVLYTSDPSDEWIPFVKEAVVDIELIVCDDNMRRELDDEEADKAFEHGMAMMSVTFDSFNEVYSGFLDGYKEDFMKYLEKMKQSYKRDKSK